ncbi:radical SAM protein [Candidatus Woesearchaeota archaeon]|nr:radical SAM protein [Candidatus Woesearchaeota archaeon]
MKKGFRIPMFKGIPTLKELEKAVRENKPLFLGIPLAVAKDTKVCQLKCEYCFIESEKRETRFTLKDHFKVIDQFSELGGKYIKTATVGEPFLDKNFYNQGEYPLIDYANSKGLFWTSFSNLVSVTPQIANELIKKEFSIIGKLNSLNPKVQEETTGNTGFYSEKHWVKFGKWFIPKYLKYLIDAGFNKEYTENNTTYTKLGVDIIVTKKNFRDIPEVVLFCLENNIYPDIETLEISGDAEENLEKLQLSDEKNKWLYKELKKIAGKEFIEDERKIVSDFCPLFTAGIVYNIDGSVRMCYNVDSSLKLNLKEKSLKEIYSQMLDVKKEVRNKVLLKFEKKKEILNPCPMGLYGRSLS